MTYGPLRKLLKRGRYAEVVSDLTMRAKRKRLKAKHDVWTEIRYLEKHGSEGHLRFPTFRRRGIPCGSGAIESVIRRVINLRLKSNAMYWLEENAEAMFALSRVDSLRSLGQHVEPCSPDRSLGPAHPLAVDRS